MIFFCVYCFTSDIDAQQQIVTTWYCSDSNIRKQLRRYPSIVYSVKCGIYSVNVRRQGSHERTISCVYILDAFARVL